MIFNVLVYISWYLVIGFISAWIINTTIDATKACEPYTPKEIALVIVLWPINVCIFAYAFIKSFFSR